MASRERVGLLLDAPPNRLTQRMAQVYDNAIGPVDFRDEQAPCQQVVHRADEPGFDLRTLLPAPTNTDQDAGPYFCLGLVFGSDPDLGTDVTIHRLCVQGPDEMSIFFAPGRHIDAFRQRAEAAGRPFHISVNMGLDPGDPRRRRVRGTHNIIPGEEHVSLPEFWTETSIFHALHDAVPGLVTEVYAHIAGGEKFLAVLKCDKQSAFDDGRAR